MVNTAEKGLDAFWVMFWLFASQSKKWPFTMKGNIHCGQELLILTQMRWSYPLPRPAVMRFIWLKLLFQSTAGTISLRNEYKAQEHLEKNALCSEKRSEFFCCYQKTLKGSTQLVKGIWKSYSAVGKDKVTPALCSRLTCKQSSPDTSQESHATASIPVPWPWMLPTPGSWGLFYEPH